MVIFQIRKLNVPPTAHPAHSQKKTKYDNFVPKDTIFKREAVGETYLPIINFPNRRNHAWSPAHRAVPLATNGGQLVSLEHSRTIPTLLLDTATKYILLVQRSPIVLLHYVCALSLSSQACPPSIYVLLVKTNSFSSPLATELT